MGTRVEATGRSGMKIYPNSVRSYLTEFGSTSPQHRTVDEHDDATSGPVNPILAENMKRLLKERGLSLYAMRAQMAEAGVPIGLGTLSRTVAGQSGSRLQSLTKIARFFDVTVDQLLQPDLGQGEPAAAGGDQSKRRRVPIISWEQAANWGDIVEKFQPGGAQEWTTAFETPSPTSFALRVKGDSMANPSLRGPSFPEGTLILVEPERRAIFDDYVIGIDTQTQQATFKQLITDGGRWFLRPLNRAYPTVEIDDPARRVVGKVTEFINQGKL